MHESEVFDEETTIDAYHLIIWQANCLKKESYGPDKFCVINEVDGFMVSLINGLRFIKCLTSGYPLACTT